MRTSSRAPIPCSKDVCKRCKNGSTRACPAPRRRLGWTSKRARRSRRARIASASGASRCAGRAAQGGWREVPEGSEIKQGAFISYQPTPQGAQVMVADAKQRTYQIVQTEGAQRLESTREENEVKRLKVADRFESLRGGEPVRVDKGQLVRGLEEAPRRAQELERAIRQEKRELELKQRRERGWGRER